MDQFHNGTKVFGLICGLIGVVIAFMLLFMGFWRTVFVALLFGAGYFIGSHKDPSAAVKGVINRLFPPKGE